MQKLGKQIVDLESELDERNAKLSDLERELEAVDRELEDKEAMHSQVIIALKDVRVIFVTPCSLLTMHLQKLGTSKSRHTELSIQHESLSTERKFLESKIEELALRCAELEEGRRTDERARNRLEDDRQSLEKALRKKEDQLQDAELARKRERAELENKYKGIIAERDQVRSHL